MEVSDNATTSRRYERPWGSYTILATEERFQVKEIVVNPGKRLSYQRHAHRSEHWFFVHGSSRVTLDGEHRAVDAGSSVDVPIGQLHRIENVGVEPLVLIEVQMGSYLGEDDIERVEDDFGRS